jgi:hypothetical protein
VDESVAEAIKAEVQRFRSHKGYTDDLRKEFALAFKRYAPTAGAAHAIGERLMISCKYYPVPQQVHEASEVISASMVPEFTGLLRTPEDSSGDLTDGMTEADLERWRQVAEHGKTKTAQGVAKAILNHHAERLQLPKPIVAEAKAKA